MKNMLDIDLHVCSRYLYKLDHFVIKFRPPLTLAILLKLRSVKHAFIIYFEDMWKYIYILHAYIRISLLYKISHLYIDKFNQIHSLTLSHQITYIVYYYILENIMV